MRKINLLYIITKLELGGAQKQLLALIKNLSRDKFNIYLFTCAEGLLLPEALAIEGLKVRKSRFLVRPVDPLKDFLALIEIFLFIKGNNIEIVHTHSSKAGIVGRLAARLAKVKTVVHTVHGWSFNDYQPEFLKKIFICLERAAAGFTDALVVVSDHDRVKGLKNRIGTQQKYYLIRYWVDYENLKIRDRRLKKELKINSDDLVVGMVACFKPQKSPEDFVRLADLVNRETAGKVRFLLVGDGYLRGKIEKLIKRLNLGNNFILTGWRKDIPGILPVMDIFVLTSLWEGMPIAALEAMAASIPVVVTNTGGIAEVVRDGENGFLAAPRDIKDMAGKIACLLGDASLRKRVGLNATSYLRNRYTIEGLASGSNNIYEYLIQGKAIKNGFY